MKCVFFFRVFIMLLVICLHSGLFYNMLYTHNTRSFEYVSLTQFMVEYHGMLILTMSLMMENPSNYTYLT